jgi:hypothetical protein
MSVFAVIQNLETKTFSYRLIWGLVFLGGLGRLLSLFIIGLPPFPMPFFIVIEILGPVVFIHWHNQIRLKSAGSKGTRNLS